MSENNSPVTDGPVQEVIITRTFNAPRELVFQAWTDPRQMARWWGPHGYTNPVCEMDVRPGGTLRIVMRAADGQEHPMTGVFKEIEKPSRLVFTCVALDGEGKALLEALTTVVFTERDGKTELALHARGVGLAPPAAQMLAGMTVGWNQSIERLADLVTNTADREIAMQRVYDAPRAMVFKAFTDPVQVARWFGPRGFTTTVLEMDVRPGGLWRYIMHAPDGTDFDNRVQYLEVVEPERLVYYLGNDKADDPGKFHVTVTFEEQNGGTRLSMRMVFATAEQREQTIGFGAVELGQQTLDCLAEHLASA